jgi:hypothetical protein
MSDVSKMDIRLLDQNLLEEVLKDLQEDKELRLRDFEAFFATDPDGKYDYHIVFCDDALRGGIVLVGGGSSGHTSWTDASSPDEVLQRYLDGDMMP